LREEIVDVSAPKPSQARRVSGWRSVAGIVLCLALTAVFIPAALHLPRWIKFEVVFASWWLVWAAILSFLLYTGRWVSDDADELKRNRGSSDRAQRGGRERESTDWWNALDLGLDLSNFGTGIADSSEGCGEALAIALAMVVFLALTWFMVEFGIPLVAGLTYLLVRGMLARAVNRWHLCRANLLRSCGEGLGWATVYTAPLLTVAFLVHEVFARR
jgi:hypothetical protein